MNKSSIKIALVDDHELFLRGLSKLLDRADDIQIVTTYKNGSSLLAAIDELQIDVLLLDLQLPDIEAEDLLIMIKQKRPELKVLYLTMMRGGRILRKLEKHGISGYILKDVSLDELQSAIKTVHKGQPYYSDGIYLDHDMNVNTVTTPEDKITSLLSPREIEVLELICQEYSSAEIAKLLYVSTSTVDTHRKKMMVKLGVSNTVGLVKYAIKHRVHVEK